MQNEFWVNLPSDNIQRAKTFFTEIGLTINERHNAPHMLGLLVGGKSVAVNFFDRKVFEGFAGLHSSADRTSTEVLLSIGANSPEEVDRIATRAVNAGGKLYAGPGYNDGWMYGCGFTDLDGHRWNVLYMDMAKMPK